MSHIIHRFITLQRDKEYEKTLDTNMIYKKAKSRCSKYLLLLLSLLFLFLLLYLISDNCFENKNVQGYWQMLFIDAIKCKTFMFALKEATPYPKLRHGRRSPANTLKNLAGNTT